MTRVLVTGGSGFIGEHLVAKLVGLGDEVRVLDLMEPRKPRADIEFVQGSVADEATVERALEGVELVYHLAGIAHLWRRNTDDFDLVNRRGTETMMRVAARAKPGRIVHCSTESILLPKRRNGAHIDESVNPTLEDMAGPYTRSKFLGERAALKAAGDGLDVVVVNPTIPVGNGDRNKTPPAAMLALFLSGRSPFFLDCVLNMVDVRDVADGIVNAGRHGRSGERYILGGDNVHLRELLPRLEEKSGRRMPRRTVPGWVALTTGVVSGWIADRVTRWEPTATREGVMLALRSAPFDCRKAKNELNYAPRPIDTALTEVVEALMQNDAPAK